MTKQKLWDKWVLSLAENQKAKFAEPIDFLKKQFYDDVQELIERHQKPYKNALDNITFEIHNLTEMELDDADTIAKRLK